MTGVMQFDCMKNGDMFSIKKSIQNTIQYNYLLFHLISYETFTKYFHKHVQHKYKE